MNVLETGLTRLRAEVRGAVLLPDTDGYAEEIAAFNLAVTHRPAYVVAATGAPDVVAAVRFAAAAELPVIVQSTGHGASVPAFDGVLISTARMRAVHIDPDAATARVAAGVVWREVIDAAARYGLAPLCGSSPQVGVVGYTLGGGLSPIGRTFGFAADHVREIEIVTADGRVRVVDHNHDPELFWALRGGKGGFGVVASITFDLFPVRTLYGGGIFYRATDAHAVVHAWRSWLQTLTDRTSSSLALLRLPDQPDLPAALRNQFVVHLRVAHLGETAEGERLVAPLRTVAEPLLDTVAEMPFTQIGAVHNDPTDPMPVWQCGAQLRELNAEAVDALLAAAGPETDLPLAIVEVRRLGGAIGRMPDQPNAVSGRDAAFTLHIIGAPVPQLFDTVIPVCGARVLSALAPWSVAGAQANFDGPAQDDTRPPGTPWPSEVYARLVAVKQTYDPADLFRFGLVMPATTGH